MFNFISDSEYGSSPVKTEDNAYSPTKPTPATPMKAGPSAIGNVQSLDNESSKAMKIRKIQKFELWAEISVSSFSFRICSS